MITAARAACADPTVPKRFRNPDDAVRSEGRAFQVDATCEDVAITREPLIPCVAITSPQDCIFGQSQPFLTSVLGAIAALDQIARCAYVAAHPGCAAARAPDEETHLLYVLLKAYYGAYDAGDDSPPPHGLSHQWAANAAVYLNSIFTCGQRMADRTIAEANALGPSACASTMQMQEAEGSPPIGWPLRRLVKPAQFAAAEKWWAPFVRAQPNLNVWLTVQPADRALRAHQRLARPAARDAQRVLGGRRPARALRRVAAPQPRRHARPRRAVAARGACVRRRRCARST